MSVFTSALSGTCAGVDTWHYVSYDQLSQDLLPENKDFGLIFIETSWKASQLPYHKQKLALLLSNQRHFALEMQEAGYPVRYVFSENEYGEVLAELCEELGEITVTKPSELSLRRSIQPLVDTERLRVLEHKGWLTTTEDFIKGAGQNAPWRMDKFYRYIRKNYSIMLEDDGKPVGGKWSLDDENRLPWDGAVDLPETLSFEPDEITLEVIEMVEKKYGHHPGKIVADNLPASVEDANQLWDWAKASVMYYFGPYEDAMTQEHRTLFHTTMSSLVNLGRIMPRTLLNDALALDIPLNSKEGFVRQIIGWREFVHHVHELTDGFATDSTPVKARPAAGWEGEWPAAKITPNVLENSYGLPPTFWGEKSGMLCLDTAITDVVETGYAHHIPRLMVLANIGNLLGIHPRELTDWFWAMFTDAYDWVVEPNVLAMGTYAVGEVMTTKPYVSGTPYIKKMGDYCGDCSLHFKKSCPISDMYWNFLEENQDHFRGNHRMAMPMRTLAKRTQQAKDTAKEVTHYVRQQMTKGEILDPVILQSIKS